MVKRYRFKFAGLRISTSQFWITSEEARSPTTTKRRKQKFLLQTPEKKMVVIEHEKPDDRNPNQSNSTAAGTDAFDGFETASEADLDSDVDESETRSREEEQQHRQQSQQQRKETEVEHVQDVDQRNISSEDALINEEELRQVWF
jgi:hypothetical protein